MALIRKEIGDLLVDNGVITPEEWEQVRAEHNKTGDSVQEILSRLGLAGEAQLKNALELQYGVNFVTLRKFEPNVQLLNHLPERMLREHYVVPIGQEGNRLTVAMVNPSDNLALDAIKSKLNGMQLKTVVCLEDDFLAFLRQAFSNDGEDYQAEAENTPVAVPAQPPPVEPGTGKNSKTITGDWPAVTPETTMYRSDQSGTDIPAVAAPVAAGVASSPVRDEQRFGSQSIKSNIQQAVPAEAETQTVRGTLENSRQGIYIVKPPVSLQKSTKEAAVKAREAQSVIEPDLAKRAQEEAIVLLANQILGGAIKRHCSNIHLIAGDKQALVQYRLNGSLFVDRKLPKAILTALVARYKMMARLNLGEQNQPQDGHIKVKSSSKEIVCLISTVPVPNGENVVIWIL